MKVGDLVRATLEAAPTEYRGALGVIIRVRDYSCMYPYLVRFLHDGEEVLMNSSEIELPEEEQNNGSMQ
jgi:hypothetical protein